MFLSKVNLSLPLFSLLFIIVLSFAYLLVNGQDTKTTDNSNSNTNTVTNIDTANTSKNVDSEKNKKNESTSKETKKKETNETDKPLCDPNKSKSKLTIAEVYDGIKVKNAYKYNEQTESAKKNTKGNTSIQTAKIKEVQLGDVIVVELEKDNLKELLAKKQCLEDDGKDKNLVLFLNNRPLINTTGNPLVNPDSNTILFTLKRNEDTKDVWTHLLGYPGFKPVKTRVSIGIEDTYAIDANQDAYVNLDAIPNGWFLFWVILFLSFLSIFGYLAVKTPLLRNPGTKITGEEKLRFSLGRTQAASWFFVILASYLFIGIITGDFSTTITGTVLSLFGITAGTAIGSAFVDVTKDSEKNKAIEIKENEISQMRETDGESISADPKKQKEIEDKKQKKERLQGISTGNFLRDILSDDNGISFHRFQAVALLVVLIIIFITRVYTKLAMPDFDGNLLTLLLISSGTYLGFKLPRG